MKNITYINAGAGAGKTYTLTNILAEKLAKKDSTSGDAIKPSQVILTTFTELAAEEFREKARQQLLAGNKAKGIESNIDAATQIDSAAIGTVHSIALQFIKKFWYLLEYGADIQTISERDADFYMSQSLARIVNDDSHKEDMENFRRFRNYYDICDGLTHPDHLFWQHYLNEVVEKMEYYGVDDVDESINKSIDTLHKIFTCDEYNQTTLDKLSNYLNKYLSYCQSNNTQTAREHAAIISPLVAKGIKNKIELVEILSVMKSPVGGKKKIENNCPGYHDFIEQSMSLQASKSDIAIVEPFIRSIFTVAKDWRDDFIAYKKNNHIISYNDMERLFLHLLENEEEVQSYVHEHYRLVMVDEFQDSNPIQLKIFNRLSELIAPEGQSFWVADPKQAIYGFRGADTELVNSVSKHFTFYDDDKIHPGIDESNLGSGRLVESWRSRDELVYLVNDCFEKAFRDYDEIDKLCITLDPHFKNEGLLSEPLVHWNITESNNQKSSDAIAYKVKELLNSGMMVKSGKRDEPATAISPRNIAILNRTNSSCKAIVKALRNQGVPVSEAEDDIIQRIEVQLVLSLLQFVQNPSDKHTIANLMRLLWHESTQDILQSRIDYVNAIEDKDAWMTNDPRVSTLAAVLSRLKNQSIPELVEAIIYECDLLTLVEQWGDPTTRRQNLSTIIRLAKDYDAMCLQLGQGSSINGFIYYLNTFEPDRERDNMSDTVKVFTYHGSKGLEWPIVIMNELWTDALDDKTFAKKQFCHVREIISEDKATKDDPFNKNYYLHFFPSIVRTLQSNLPDILLDNIIQLDIYQQMKRRAKGEERRLLYVGMTRAKDCIYTIGRRGNFSWLINAGLSGSSDDNIWGIGKYQPVRVDVSAPEAQASAVIKGEYAIPIKPSSHNTRQYKYLSPSTLDKFEGFDNHHVFGQTGYNIPTRGWNKADYATIGSCIHDFFAVFVPGNAEWNKKCASNIIRGYGLSDILCGHIDAIIASAEHLYSELGAKYPSTHTEREYPFSIELPTGQILRGEMDLLWFYNDTEGEHCILVDYKSYPGFDLNEHTKSHYAQLSAYADSLRRSQIDVTHSIVYYPVHGVIHELAKSASHCR